MRGVIVAQTDARSRSGVRAPLSIGIVRAPEATALVAKLTLDVAGARPEVVEPAAVGPAVASELDPDRWAYPTDFRMPARGAAVLLHGHAHAAQPEQAIEARIVIAERWQQRIAVSAAPARRREIPLPGGTSLPIQELVPGSRVELFGLSPRAAERAFALPRLAPRVLLDGAYHEPIELELVCDTLWLDTDLEQLILVWRGLLPDPDTRSLDRILVSLEATRAARPVAEMLGDLPRGTVSFAIEEQAVIRDSDRLEMARWELLEHTAEPELDLDGYAAIAAELAEGREPREEVLARHALAEHEWLIEERAWSEKLAREAQQGDASLAGRLAEALGRHQQRLAGPHEPRSLEEYARIKAALEDTPEPHEVLARHRIGLGEWTRLDRHFSAAAARDPALAARLAELVSTGG